MNMQTIGKITPLWDTLPIWQKDTDAAALDDAAPLFADIFRSAIESVKETDAAKNEAEYLLATGQLDNPAVVSIASTKAQLSLNMLIELRNRALDAYNELSRLSI